MKLNKFAYAILLITMLFFFILYIDTLSLILLIFVIAFPFILYGSLIYLKHKISAEICLESSGSKGEEIPVTLHLKNTSKIPVPHSRIVIKYRNSVEKKYQTFIANIPIQASNENVISFNISSVYAGCILTECTEIRIYDFIKLFSVKVKQIKNKNMIFIYPECQNIEAVLSSSSNSFIESDIFSKIKSGDDPSEVFDIREYNAGDKVNRIHWKLSIKTDTLMVKENSLPISNGILIFSDTYSSLKSANPAESLGCILEVLVSISDFLVQNEILHSVSYYNSQLNENEIIAVENDDETYEAVGKVMANTFSDDGTLNNMAEHFDIEQNGLLHAILITATLSTTILRSFLDLNSENKTVIYVDEAGYDFMHSSDNAVFIKITPEKIRESLSDLTI